MAKKIIATAVIAVLLSGCATRTIRTYDKRLPRIQGPSDCGVNWVLDPERSIEAPDCVLKDLVDHKAAKEAVDGLSGGTTSKIEWTIKGLWVAGIAGAAALFYAIKTAIKSLLF